MPYLCLFSSRLLELDASAWAASFGGLHLELARPTLTTFTAMIMRMRYGASEHMDDVSRHTYIHKYSGFLVVLISVGLAQACPNNINIHSFWFLEGFAQACPKILYTPLSKRGKVKVHVWYFTTSNFLLEWGFWCKHNKALHTHTHTYSCTCMHPCIHSQRSWIWRKSWLVTQLTMP